MTDIPIQNIDIKQTVLNFISFFKELVSKKLHKLCTQLLQNSFKAPKQLKIAKANSNSLLTLQASTPQNGQTHLRMVLYSPVKALVIETNFALNPCHANIPFVSLRKIMKTRNFLMFSGGWKVNLLETNTKFTRITQSRTTFYLENWNAIIVISGNCFEIGRSG